MEVGVGGGHSPLQKSVLYKKTTNRKKIQNGFIKKNDFVDMVDDIHTLFQIKHEPIYIHVCTT